MARRRRRRNPNDLIVGLIAAVTGALVTFFVMNPGYPNNGTTAQNTNSGNPPG
jgi:capsular polysaccharide biosynthesis protein